MENWQGWNKRWRPYFLTIHESDREAGHIEYWRTLRGYDSCPASERPT